MGSACLAVALTAGAVPGSLVGKETGLGGGGVRGLPLPEIDHWVHQILARRGGAVYGLCVCVYVRVCWCLCVCVWERGGGREGVPSRKIAPKRREIYVNRRVWFLIF